MTVTLDHHLPPRTGWAGVVERGDRLRILEVDGGQYGMCSRWIFHSGQYRGLVGGFAPWAGQGLPNFGCWEILTGALAPWNIPAEDVPSPLNVFQTMRIDLATGALAIEPGRSKPGDYIEFRAEMNCLCALSACPCGGKSSRVQVLGG